MSTTNTTTTTEEAPKPNTTNTTQSTHHAIIGPPTSNTFWLYTHNQGFDLTHPSSPCSPPLHPRLTLPTLIKPITLHPPKTALVIIDMQNFFLSPAFGRDTSGAGHAALREIRERAVPAARKAGVQVVWVNWGLDERELEEMPAGVRRVFGFEASTSDGKGVIPGGGGEGRDAVFGEGGGKVVVADGKDPRVYRGMGSECGILDDPVSGSKVDAGRLLMRGSWNADLYGPLNEMYEEGRKLPDKPDVWIHKNRMSALWGGRTALDDFLEKEGIRSLLFTGVNTDQCVGGTMQDAFSKGYDCVLLSDGAGTSSPEFAQKCIEYNVSKSWGFVSTCEEFVEALERMERS